MGVLGGAGGGCNPSLSARGNGFCAAAVGGGGGVAWSLERRVVPTPPMPAIDVGVGIGSGGGQPQDSFSLSTTCWRLPCSKRTRWLGWTR